ncbi:MAG: hypothetical protein JSU82_17205 [Rhodospirillales bacterium]|nr:MAG: hypothetical protein JSU82_17205 [Rhodospirillales bacterium]
MFEKYIRRQIFIAFVSLALVGGGAVSAAAQETIVATPIAAPIQVDGDLSDWVGVPAHRIQLTGRGGVGSVEMKFAIHNDMIYVMAVWEDSTESRLHKPYQWDPQMLSYRRSAQLEDRFAINFLMSGEFSNDKTSGAEFTADVWHWKASRSDPAGIAHDKMWRVSRSEFPGAKKFTTSNGQSVYLARPSDAGDRLYRAVKHDTKREDIMPRYDVNLSPNGSIADIRAKGVWHDGRWHLEMARKLDTGHDDDAVIPASGRIPFAVAAFNDVDSDDHSVSDVLSLQTGGYGN